MISVRVVLLFSVRPLNLKAVHGDKSLTGPDGVPIGLPKPRSCF